MFVIACFVLLHFVMFGQSQTAVTETIQVTPNIATTVCRELHLCQHKGCGTHWNQNSACQCDSACAFFDDCCFDYDTACTQPQRAGFFDSLSISSFECVNQTIKDSPHETAAATGNFWMVSQCPENDQISDVIRQNCQTPSTANPTTFIPVTDANNLTFRNVYCALCHGRPTDQLTPWQLNVTCQPSVLEALQTVSLGVKYQRIVWDQCEHFFQPPAVQFSGPVIRRPCVPHGITDCGNAEQAEITEQEEACRSFTALVATSGVYYRNPVCYALCGSSDGQDILPCRTAKTTTVQNVRNISVGDVGGIIYPPPDSIKSHPASVAGGAPLLYPLSFGRPSLSVHSVGGPPPRERPLHVQCLSGYVYDLSSGECLPQNLPLPTLPEVFPNGQPQNQPLPLPISAIFHFGQGDQECERGNFYDSLLEICLGPTCPHGFHYEASDSACKPREIVKLSENFYCLSGHYQGKANLSLIVVLEAESLASDDREDCERSTKALVQDLLSDHFTVSEKETDDSNDEAPSSPKSSSNEFAFLIDLKDQEESKFRPSDDTDLADEDSFWKGKLDSAVWAIKKVVRQVEKRNETKRCGFRSAQIVQTCGQDVLRGTNESSICQETLWIPNTNGTQTSSNNDTILFFDEASDTWYNASAYRLRLRFRIPKEGSDFNESSEIGLCQAESFRSCPVVDLDISQFMPVLQDTANQTDESLIFIETGRTLSPADFTRTPDGRIRVCSSLLKTTPFFNFTRAQSILSTIGLSISILAGILTLITYSTFPSLHSRTRTAIMGMAASLIAAQILLLTNAVASGNKSGCTVVAVAGHFMWMASLTWTNVLAFLLWRTFTSNSPTPSGGRTFLHASKTTLWSMAYAFGVPLIIITICIVIHFCKCTEILMIYNTERVCWIRPGLTNLVVFGVPIASFLLANIVLFTRIVWAIRSSHSRADATFRKGNNTSTLARRRKELMIYVRMASLMGFTWLFGFVSNGFSKVQVLWYVFIILNSLQGLFIFLSFTFTSQVKKMWKKKLSRGKASVVSKTTFFTSKGGASSSGATSVSAGIAASESHEMSSNISVAASAAKIEECLKKQHRRR